jgi:hypothetical protein
VDQDLKTRFDQHPYGALAAALGVGYVLGGGFFTPLTGHATFTERRTFAPGRRLTCE